MFELPANGQGFIHLDVLARLNTAPAKNALIWVVEIEGIGYIDFIRLCLVRNRLVLDGKQRSGVMDSTVAVVVIADGAIQHVIAEDTVKCLALRCVGPSRFRDYFHSFGSRSCASSYQLSVNLNHACVAG